MALLHTPLYEAHKQAGAKLVDFAGWEMPLHYGSQIEEHHAVRQQVGMFDVSHMGVLDVTGEDAKDYLRYVLANDVAKLVNKGKALYSCMLNAEAGVVDDLIVYYLDDNYYRIVLNAGTRNSDIAWLKELAERYIVTLTERTDMAVVAIQGPNAIQIAESVLQVAIAQLKPFNAFEHDGILIARTGYTGEDGVELIVPTKKVRAMWDNFVAVGVRPCGLGARDTLRLEAGFNLYGSDMDQGTSPLVSNLAWTVDWKDNSRDFVGKQALLEQKQQGVPEKLVGLVMESRGVLRDHQTVFIDGVGEGEITSGSFSPTLGCAIALARVPYDTANQGEIERRNQRVAVNIVKLPFVRHGKKSKTLNEGN